MHECEQLAKIRTEVEPEPFQYGPRRGRGFFDAPGTAPDRPSRLERAKSYRASRRGCGAGFGDGPVPLPDVGQPYALSQRVKPRIRVKAISRPRVVTAGESEAPSAVVVALPETEAEAIAASCFGGSYEGRAYESFEPVPLSEDEIAVYEGRAEWIADRPKPAPAVVAFRPRVRVSLHLLASASVVAYARAG
jgi:hypothetical protein